MIGLAFNINNGVYFNILGDQELLFIKYLLDEYGMDTPKNESSLVHGASCIQDWFNEYSGT